VERVEPTSEERINVRVSKHPASEGTEELLARAKRIDISYEAFQRFAKELGSPAEEMPLLRRYAREHGTIFTGCGPTG
jgi:hypothetical protein